MFSPLATLMAAIFFDSFSCYLPYTRLYINTVIKLATINGTVLVCAFINYVQMTKFVKCSLL